MVLVFLCRDMPFKIDVLLGKCYSSDILVSRLLGSGWSAGLGRCLGLPYPAITYLDTACHLRRVAHLLIQRHLMLSHLIPHCHLKQLYCISFLLV